MCTLCLATGTFDPSRHPDGLDPFYATVSEKEGAKENTNTTNSMSVGDSFVGSLSDSADADWVKINFVAGETYEISLNGGSLSDPYLYLMDSAGSLLTYNDDGGSGYNSKITYTASSSGTYHLVADAYSSETGTYTLSVNTSEPDGSAGTLDDLALFLTEGYAGREIKFNTSSSNVITVNLSGLTTEGKQLARWAMDAWEAVVDLDFVEVSSGEMITMDDESGGAYAYFPGYGGSDGVELNVSRAWLSYYGTSIDSYSFQTFVHEIGHAIGLGHQGDYNGSATYGIDNNFSNDSWQMSIMSYFSQSENTTTNASQAYLAGPMMADILASQNLYGAPGNSTVTAGDTTYGANSNIGNYLDEVFDELVTGRTTSNVRGNPIAFTIYDQGGYDTLDLSYLSSGARIDMRAEQFSDFGGLIGNMGIARGTVLEKAKLGSGNDTVTGNAANNIIIGGSGNDTLYGGDGSDKLKGGTGHDNLYDGNGDDELSGGSGTDWAFFSDNLANYSFAFFETSIRVINDFVDIVFNDVEWFSFNGNAFRYQDLLTFSDDYSSYIEGSSSDDILYGSNSDDFIFGDSGDDKLIGNVGDDVLYGGIGKDKLNGGSGHDALFGGIDDDTLQGGTGNDILDGGDGIDTIFFTGTTNATVRIGRTSAQDTGYGFDTIKSIENVISGNGDDEVYGNSQSNTIKTYGGNDRVYAGVGVDVVELGIGNDYVRVGGGIETFAGGSGRDYISYYDSTKGVNINLATNAVSGSWASNDTISGFESVSGSKKGGDKVHGNSASNKIKTYGGADKLEGARGNDKLYGGTGRDKLYGEKNDDKLYGGSSNDTLKGGKGKDKLYGGSGKDKLYGEKGDDKLYGGSSKDTLKGGSGKDRLDGGTGNDKLFGGSGADTFVFNKKSGKDTIEDFGGNDVIAITNGVNRLRDIDFTDTKAGLLIEFGKVDIFLDGIDSKDVSSDDFDFI